MILYKLTDQMTYPRERLLEKCASFCNLTGGEDPEIILNLNCNKRVPKS